MDLLNTVSQVLSPETEATTLPTVQEAKPADLLAPLRGGLEQGREFLNEFQVGGAPLELAAMSLGGILLLFWGKIIFRAWLLITGLLTGWSIGAEINTKWLGLTDNPQLIFHAVLALAFALLFSVGFRFSFFLAGAVAGIYVLGFLLELAGIEPIFYFYIIAAVIGGALASQFRDLFTTIATSITGAFLLTDALLAIVKLTPAGFVIRLNIQVFSSGTNILILILIIAFTALGIWSQSRRGRWRRR